MKRSELDFELIEEIMGIYIYGVAFNKDTVIYDIMNDYNLSATSYEVQEIENRINDLLNY